MGPKYFFLYFRKIKSIYFFDKDVFKTIDFVVEGFKKPVFQTSEKEKGKVVFQLVINKCDKIILLI